jgi:release factor glutamine methyltransferase
MLKNPGFAIFIMGGPSSTINFMGLRLDVFNDVYVPREDSFLLAKHTHKLEGNILELGAGCGISALANASRNPSNYVLGVDISQRAVNNANYNAKHNRVGNATFVRSDLFSKVPKLRFDAVLFNPPYLPQEGRESKSMLDLALYSGKDGREATDRFLGEVSPHLLPGGKAFLVQSSATDIPKTLEKAHSLGFSAEILEEQSFFFEKLCLLELFRE